MLLEQSAKPARIAGMSSSTHSPVSADWSSFLPDVQLEVRQGTSRPVQYTLNEVDFLVGSLPGCDLRVPGTEHASILCLFARHPAGVTLRKLTPSQHILVNGRSATHVELSDGDSIRIGLCDIQIRISPPREGMKTSANLEEARRELQERVAAFREQLLHWQKEKETFNRERQEFAEQQPQTDAELLQEIRQRDRSIEQLQHELGEARAALQQLSHERLGPDESRRTALNALQQDIDRRTIEVTQQVQRFEDERLALVQLAELSRQRQDEDQSRREQLDALQQELDQQQKELHEVRARSEEHTPELQSRGLIS